MLAFCQFCLQFERLNSKQILDFLKSILSKFQCGFRKSYGDGHYLLMILKTWKETIDNDNSFAAFLTGLSKAFDCSSHDLWTAKLQQAYGLALASLNIPCRLLDK